jgi:drug/metabolite transporter (DMT)-like permease
MGAARGRTAMALALVYVAWGATYPAIAVVVRTVPPWTAMGARFLAAGLVLGGALRLLGRPDRSTWRERSGAVVVGPWILGSIGIIAVAEKHVESGLAALLIGSVPLWVVVIERLLGLRPLGRTRAVAGLVGFAGLALVVGPGGGGDLAWVADLLGAAAFEASGELGGTRVVQPADDLWATVWQLAGAGVVLLGAGALTGELGRLRPWAGETWVAFAFLVLVGSVVAYPALVWLLAHTPTSTASTYAYVNPVVALLIGAVLLDERLSPLALAGAAVVLAGVAGVVAADRRRA